MKRNLSLKEYLGKEELIKELQINQNTTFHWSNWDQTCKLQKSRYKNSLNDTKLVALNNSIFELKKTPMWIRNQTQTLQVNLFYLYNSYLSSSLRDIWFNPKKEVQFSAEGPTGNFYPIATMKWFHKDIYAQLVMQKILLEEYNMRSFRLTTSIPISLKFDTDPKDYHALASIHQLSEAGIMFKISNKSFVEHIKNAHLIDCSIPITYYQDALELQIEEAWEKVGQKKLITNDDIRVYKLDAKILEMYGNTVNARRSGEKEFYIFAKYEDLKPLDHEISLQSVFCKLVSNTKEHFAKELASGTGEKQAA